MKHGVTVDPTHAGPLDEQKGSPDSIAGTPNDTTVVFGQYQELMGEATSLGEAVAEAKGGPGR